VGEGERAGTPTASVFIAPPKILIRDIVPRVSCRKLEDDPC
jgi:hypothetical protein